MFLKQNPTFLNKLMHKTDGRKKKTNHNTTDLFKAILYTDGNRSTTVCYMFWTGKKGRKENPYEMQIDASGVRKLPKPDNKTNGQVKCSINTLCMSND